MKLVALLVAVLAAGVVLGLVVAARRDRARTRHLRVWAANLLESGKGTIALYRGILGTYAPPYLPLAAFIETTLNAGPTSKAWQALDTVRPEGLAVDELLVRLLEAEHARERGTGCQCQREKCPLHRGRAS